MVKTKQPDLHQRAIKVFEVIKKTDNERRAQNTVKHYNDRRREHVVNKVKPMLEEMQAAFDRGEQIGGCTSLKQWCKGYKHYGALSYARCRQILTGKSGNEGKVKSLDLGDTLRIGKRKFRVVSLGDPSFPHASDENGLECHEGISQYDHSIQYNLVEIKEELTHSYNPTSGGAFTRCGLANTDKAKLLCTTDDSATCPECLKVAAKPAPKAKRKKARKIKLFSSVDMRALDKYREKEYMKKFRAAKRAAKFFGGMYMEFANGVNRDYKRFLELYRPDGDDRKYPWTPPQKGYSLPKTEKEFLAQNDAASEEFNKLLDEGIAKGVLTTAPRETQHPAAKALAATVDGADVPQVCDESSDAA